jgi:hypothetical protein
MRSIAVSLGCARWDIKWRCAIMCAEAVWWRRYRQSLRII